MARINIEDELYKDARFLTLVSKVGLDAAIGSIVRAFTVAQKYWLKNESKIPAEVWKKQMLNQGLVDVGLATLHGDGYYVAGSKEQFAWLIKLKESGKKGGDLSGKIRSNKNNELPPSSGEATLKPPLSLCNPLYSLLSSPSSNLNSHDSLLSQKSENFEDMANLIHIESKKKRRKAEPSAGVQSLIAHYCDLWFSKYKASAPISGRSAGCFKTLVRDHGLEKATLFVDAFMQMNDSWYATKRHDISALLANLNAVAQFAETGRMFTKREINDLDRSSTNQETLRALEAGEI